MAPAGCLSSFLLRKTMAACIMWECFTAQGVHQQALCQAESSLSSSPHRTGPPGPSAQAALLAAGAVAHEEQQQALTELTSRLKRAEQRSGRLEAELLQEKRSSRGLALQCRQAAMQMKRLQVWGVQVFCVNMGRRGCS